MPPPKDVGCTFCRSTLKPSGSSYCSGSRFAAPSRVRTCSPLGMVTPLNSTSSKATRPVICTELSNRSISSTALGTNDGSAFSFSHSSGLDNKCSMPLPSMLTVVSCPAPNSSIMLPISSSSLNFSPSSAALRSSEVMSSPGSLRRRSNRSLKKATWTAWPSFTSFNSSGVIGVGSIKRPETREPSKNQLRFSTGIPSMSQITCTGRG